MSKDISLLDDADLKVASGGISNTAMDGVSGLDNSAPATTVGRVRTSDKQTKAVTAFIKG